MNLQLDYAKVSQDQKIRKQLQPDEIIISSINLVKINRVNKRQYRILLLTNKNIYNILPQETFLGLFSRIKRKIPYSKIIGMTISRNGDEFVIHVDKEHDYRFSTSRKIQIAEIIAEYYCKCHKDKMTLYYQNDKQLQQYTTKIGETEVHLKKKHMIQPLYVDKNSFLETSQAESKIVFKSTANKENICTFEEFELLKVLKDEGPFGKTMLCQNKKNSKYYMIKCLHKQEIILNDFLGSMKAERYLLEKADHPFLRNIQYAFQSKQKVFFVTKFIPGGQLFKYIRAGQVRRFPQKRAKFYAAQVFLAIKHLHELGYVFRNIRTQNILLDLDGYVKLWDYAIALQLKPGQKIYNQHNHPNFASPQLLEGTGQNFTVDWYSLGVFIYEMVFGFVPFDGSIFKLPEKIKTQQPKFEHYGIQISDNCKNLIFSLMNKNPDKRLGVNETDIMSHPWFEEIDWVKLVNKEIEPDFIPVMNQTIDLRYYQLGNQEAVNPSVTTDLLLLQLYKKEFEGLDYDPNENQITKKQFKVPKQLTLQSKQY